jgi:hypothetical protein
MKDSDAKWSAWRRLLVVALLPLTILFWMTGWMFYWLGDQRRLVNVTRKEPVSVFKKEERKQKCERNASPQQIFT